MKTTWVKLSDVCETTSGGTPLRSVADYYGGDIPWVKSGELLDGWITDTEEKITKAGLASSSAKLFPAGTLLIALYGATVGRLGILGIDATTNQAVCGITPNEQLDRDFLFYYLLKQREKLIGCRTGGAQPNISQEIIRELDIPLPPLTEQKRIASLLARADRLRHLRRTAHELGESLLQSVFLEMFGDPVTNEKGYEVYYLAELCESPNGIKAGPFGSSLKKEIYTKSGYRIYGQEQVIGGSFSIGDYYISKEMFEKDFKPYEVKPKDILISLVGTFGKTIIIPEGIEPGIINPRLLKISPRKDRLNSVFLSEYLQLSSVQKRLSDLSHGGTMGILNAGQLKEFKVICPPLSLQEEFAGVVARVEQMRARQAESERQVENLFESLLAQSFGDAQ
ncbi:MAG: restriction endonuclease subunit S [Chloroflexota bacterium]